MPSLAATQSGKRLRVICESFFFLRSLLQTQTNWELIQKRRFFRRRARMRGQGFSLRMLVRKQQTQGFSRGSVSSRRILMLVPRTYNLVDSRRTFLRCSRLGLRLLYLRPTQHSEVPTFKEG